MHIVVDWLKEMRDLGMEAFSKGNYVVAAKVLAKFVQSAPPDAEAMAACGLALGALGMQSQALKVFDHLVRLFPHSSSAHYHQGVALEKAGKVHEAARAYHKTLECRPKHRLARERLQALQEDGIDIGSQVPAADAPPLPLTRHYLPKLAAPGQPAAAELSPSKEAMDLPLSRHLMKRLEGEAKAKEEPQRSSGTIDLLPAS